MGVERSAKERKGRGRKGRERKEKKGESRERKKKGRKELNLGVEGKPWSPVSQKSKEERDNEVM